jgi:LysR family transcriptional regulator, glycine cleavage system transcriptional activator
MSSMSRLPPLNALKAFEAAARHLSFTRGAEALNVSQSAISHQVRLLESHMGKPLFRRSPSGLVLTEVGVTLFDSVHEAFGIIMAAVSEANPGPQDELITLTLRPFLSFNWLSPKLSQFYERYPDKKIKLHHRNNNIDLENDDFDLAIVLGDGNWPGMQVDFLIPCELTPLCSPRFCSDDEKPQQLSDLKIKTLLDEGDHAKWERWLALAGDTNPGARRHVFIDDTNVRIQAAIKGQGIVLSNPKLLSPEIENGNLVAPFDIMLTDYNYYIVCKKNKAKKRKTKILRDWLIEQATASI